MPLKTTIAGQTRIIRISHGITLLMITLPADILRPEQRAPGEVIPTMPQGVTITVDIIPASRLALSALLK